MTAPWDEELPELNMSITGMEELYAYLERLRQGIAAVMGGAATAHAALHGETSAVDARVTELAAQVTATATTASAALMAAAQSADKAETARALAAANAAKKIQRVTARAAIPSITLGGSTTLTLTWSTPPAVTPTAVEVWVEATGSLLGAMSASVVAGSVTATGCKVLVASTLSVALGAASVRVDGAFWA